MLDTVINLFTRKDSRRNAVLGLARIISRYDLVNLSYRTGLRENRRARDEHHASWGVWLFPCSSNATCADFQVSTGLPAVTHDLRGEGLGIMTPIRLKSEHFIIAVPDEDGDTWKFFHGQVRHNTRRPGGWCHLGIQVESTVTLEHSQVLAFREHIRGIENASAESS